MPEYGIFPTPEQLGLIPADYWQLCGLLGIVCGFLFWDRLFR